MKNTVIRYQYDGSNFYGSQKQADKRTVQGEMEQALRFILKEKIRLISAGRTDRGVHALEQVSNFDSRLTIPYDRLFLALSNLAPPDIGILSVDEAEPAFNARFSAKEREYRYVLTERKSPFTARYQTYVERLPEIDRFREIMAPLEGEHNFRNFMLVDTVEKNPVKNIFFIRMENIGDTLAVTVRGNSFGKSQIRLMLGAALDVYWGKRPADYIRRMLAEPDKLLERKLAPPNGLYLSRIIY
ncbi:MAG: tRNA pseudouridine(38-40) synthase TruA [Fusobacteriaceae bacterium]|jgi:tRNA pseudouridine38-40 synthase|nr:tRNA pseudouridine(38-40) synthase TruA [Fusobacteriaceae bacterium]